MLSFSTFVIAVIVGVILALLFKPKKWKNLPPGPRSWPVVGNVIQMGAHPQLKLMEWVEEYGKIFTVYFGQKRLIVISDAQLLREAFVHPKLNARMDMESFQEFSRGFVGIINSEGETWVEQRRFALRTLRDLGLGKKSIMEGLIMDEVNDYMTFLKANEGCPTSPQSRLNISILNVIWGLLSEGHRVNHDDAKFVDIFSRQKVIVENMAKSGTMFVPGLAKLIPRISGWNAMIKLRDELFDVFDEHVNEHKKRTEEGDTSEPRDFIEAYLREIRATTDPQSSFFKETGEKNLKAIMSDFFGAGPDTSSSTIAWAVLYLTKFPQVQNKFQAEIDEVIGKQRQPTLVDRTNMPYTCAIIEEVLRMSSIVPLGVFHRALDDVIFHDYDIPKGSWICHNQYYLQNSKALWGNPEVFEPERHFMKDGKTLKRHENLMAFGNGKRACVGEALARDSVFLFVVTIFQKYGIKLSEETANVTLDPLPGFVLPPQHYEIVVKDRF